MRAAEIGAQEGLRFIYAGNLPGQVGHWENTRCPSCQTALWSDYGGRPNLRFVRVGTLDDPAALPPDVHIFVRSKLPWVTLPDGAPAFDVYYDSKSLWPEASLERRRAILGQ